MSGICVVFCGFEISALSKKRTSCWALTLPNCPTLPLNITQIHRLPQRGQRVPRGHELVRHVALEAGRRDPTHHSIPLHFLRTVELMPAGNPTRVEVSKPLNVLLDGANQVSFHDLHVVDVVQQLDTRRVHCLRHPYSP